MFRLLRYFSLTSFVSVVVVAAILGVFYRELAVHSLVTMGESNNRAITRVLANSLWPTLMPYLATADDAADRTARGPPGPRSSFDNAAGDASARADRGQGQGLRHARAHRVLDRGEADRRRQEQQRGISGSAFRHRHERAHASRPVQRIRQGDRERRPAVDLHPGAAHDGRVDRGGLRGLRRRHAVSRAHRAHAVDGGARRVRDPLRALRRAVRDRAPCRRRDPAPIPAARRGRARAAPGAAHARAARRGAHARARSRQRRTAGRGRRTASRRPARRAHGASRRADRPAQPHAVHRSRRTGDRARAPQRTARSPCCSSISTASRTSTTRSVTPSATSC